MKNTKFTASTDIILVILSFIIFVISVIEMRDVVLVKGKILNKIFQNLNTEPIEEISIARNFCNEEMEFVNFFNYSFPGVKAGSLDVKHNIYYDTPCSLPKDDLSCIDIPSINAKSLNVWHDKTFCLKRMKNSQDVKIIKSSQQDCPEGYHLCGIYNSFGDKACYPNSVNCPVNFVTISGRHDFPDGYKYLPIAGSLYLVYSSISINESMPIDFQVSEGGYPCLEIERVAYNLNYTLYPRMKKKELYGCNRTQSEYRNFSEVMDEGYDKRYRLLDKMLKIHYFEDNDLDYKYNSLPPVADWKNDMRQTNYYLYSRSYISLNYSCLEEGKSFNFQNDLDTMKQKKFIQMVVALLNIIALVLLISILSVAKILNKISHTLLGVLKIIMMIGFMVYNIYSAMGGNKIASELDSFFKLIITKGCADLYTVYAMERYEIIDNINELQTFCLYQYIFSYIYGGVTFLQLCRYLYKAYIRVKNRYRRKMAKKELGAIGKFDESSLLWNNGRGDKLK